MREDAWYYREQEKKLRIASQSATDLAIRKILQSVAKDYGEIAEEDLDRNAIQVRHPELRVQKSPR
jgi:uncharacterized phage-associated protein